MGAIDLDDLVRRIAALERATEGTRGDTRTVSSSATSAADAALAAQAAAAAAEAVAAAAQAQAAAAAAAAAVADSNASAASSAASSAAAAASAAQSTANAASTTANGKNRVFRTSGAPSPPTGGFAVNDLWFDSANDNRPNIWTGSSWIPYALGMAALVVGNLDAGAITTGTLAAARIAATALNADNITSGTLTARNYFSSTFGVPRLAIGPSFYDGGYPVIYWDLNGDGSVSTADPRIHATNAGLTVSAGSLKARITLTDVAGQIVSPSAIASLLVTNNDVQLTHGSTSAVRVTATAVNIVNNVNLTGNLHASGNLGAESLKVNQGTLTPNINVGSSGILKMGTPPSSERYKYDIGPLGADLSAHKLYDLEVVQFRYNPGFIAGDDPRINALLPGFIAEDVAEHYPIAADLNEDGQVQDWNFRFLVPPMLKLIQDQRARIVDLEARVWELEARP